MKVEAPLIGKRFASESETMLPAPLGEHAGDVK